MEEKCKEELIEMAAKIQKYLEDECHPYTTVEISMDGIKVKEDLIYIPTSELVDNDGSCLA